MSWHKGMHRVYLAQYWDEGGVCHTGERIVVAPGASLPPVPDDDCAGWWLAGYTTEEPTPIKMPDGQIGEDQTNF